MKIPIELDEVGLKHLLDVLRVDHSSWKLAFDGKLPKDNPQHRIISARHILGFSNYEGDACHDFKEENHHKLKSI